MAVKQLNDKFAIITDVVFFWSKVHEPAPKYNPDDGREYSVNCFIDADTVKQLKKMKINKNFNEVDEDKYPEHEGLYVLKLTQNELKRDGSPLPKPVVIDRFKSPIEDNIGNGSTGQVKIYMQEGIGASKGKLNVKLSAMMVENLIPYEGGNSAADGFDTEDAPAQVADDDDDDIPF